MIAKYRRYEGSLSSQMRTSPITSGGGLSTRLCRHSLGEQKIHLHDRVSVSEYSLVFFEFLGIFLAKSVLFCELWGTRILFSFCSYVW